MTTPKTVVYEISALLQAIANCEKSGNAEWKLRHTERIESLVREYMPSGSGVDAGTKLDWQRSKPEKLVFLAAFHHMNDAGYYDGWSNHFVTVTPSFMGLDVRVSGQNRNDIKDYLAEIYTAALIQTIEGSRAYA